MTNRTIFSNTRTSITAMRQAIKVVFIVLMASVGARAQLNNTYATDGQTPLAMAPGAPAGSYALSGFDNVNLFNGNLNFRLPLRTVVGRGNATMTMTLPIETHWKVLHFFGCSGFSCQPTDNFYPIPGSSWSPLVPGYSPGVLVGRRAGKDIDCGVFNSRQIGYTLTRLTFLAPDGTEYELRDQSTGGKPYDFSSTACSGAIPNFDRGSVFVTADGTAMTFIADQDHPITDGVGFPEVIYPWGYLMLRDGTRMRIEDGVVTWLRDRNGNQLNFEYDQYKFVTRITDSLNRVTTITYADPAHGRNYDEINFKGFQGATRSIKVWFANLHDCLRSGAAQGSTGFSIMTYKQLFAELNGADETFQNDPVVVSSVELPDGRRYQFFYNSYGEIARAVLPTGGAFEYDYASGSGVRLISPPPGESSFSYEIQRRCIEKRVYSDTSGLILENRTTYLATEVNQSYPNPSSTTVDVNAYDGAGALLMHGKHYFYDTALHSFASSAIEYGSYLAGKEYLTESYDGAGNVLRKEESQFEQRAPISWWANWTATPGGGTPYFEPPNDTRLVDATATLTDVSPNLVSKQHFAYDGYNNRTDAWEYDFGQNAAPTNPLRRTRLSYLTVNPINGINYATDTDVHLRSLVKDQTVFQVDPATGAETIAAQATFEYDKYDTSANHASLLARSGISGLDAGFSTGRSARGNQTAVSRWVNTSNAWITTYHQFDVAGNPLKTIDGRGLTTTMDYADRFGAPDGEAQSDSSPVELASVGQSSFCFVSNVQNPLGHIARTQYDYYLGRAVDAEDANGSISSGYFNDVLDRPTQFVEAANIPTLRNQTTYIYDDVALIVTTSTDRVTYGDNVSKSQVVYDALGRQIESRKYEGGTAYIANHQNLDALGRVHQVSNPFRPGDTILWTTTDYDLLGRAIRVTTPDGAQASSEFAGNSVTSTDQALKKRQATKDALGRISKVVEAPTSLNFETVYAYNALDKLTAVTQGTQSRTFDYDSLGRLTRTLMPEHDGPTLYVYDDNSNLRQLTDPRGIVITNTYDAINRITFRDYSDSTPDVTYAYDSALVPSSKGRVTSITNGVSSFSYDEYDALGEILHTTQGIDGQSYQMSYQYNLAGMMTSETYPSGRMVTTAYDAAGRMSGLTGQKTGEQNKTYASSLSYTAHGAVGSMNLGNSLIEQTAFNGRLQPTQIRLGMSSVPSSVLELDYTYNTTSQSNNNGKVLSQRIIVGGSQAMDVTQNYVYDSLNRLATVTEVRTSDSSQQWRQTYDIDRYGNRAVRNTSYIPQPLLTPQSTSATDFSAFNQSNNRIQLANFGYDPAGNLTGDPTTGPNNIAYDGENRMISYTKAGVTTSYSYDGDGHRVKKSDSTGTVVMVYNAGGQLIAEYATNPGSGGTSYLTTDHLGSTRVVTKQDGTVRARYDYLPFGEELNAGTGGRTTAQGYSVNDSTRQRFTGKEHDGESGLDYFLARYYSSAQGRFTSSDPLLSSGSVYDPQTWNRYSYTLNNPLKYIDPFGLYVYGTGATDELKKKFEKGLKDLEKARDSFKKGSKEYNRLDRSLKAFGAKGVDNGVTVRFATAPTPGNTDPGIKADAAGNKITTPDNPTGQDVTVTIDPSQNRSNTDYAFTAAHEGSHVADVSELAGALPTNLTHFFSSASSVLNDESKNLRLFFTEFRAFETESFAAQALTPNQSTSVRGNEIWSGGWAEADRAKKRTAGIIKVLAEPKSAGGRYGVTPFAPGKKLLQ